MAEGDSLSSLVGLGTVKQDAGTDFTSGMGNGMQLAAAQQALQQKQQSWELQKTQIAQQQSQWFASQLYQTASIVDPTVRGAEAKRLLGLAQQANIPVDPSIPTLLKDDQHAQTIRTAYMNMFHVPVNDANKAALDTMQAAGNPADFEKQLFNLGDMNVRMNQFNVQRQFEQQKFGMEQQNSRQEAVTKSTQDAYTRNKDNVEQIKYANNIIRAANDPAQRTDAVSSAETTANMLKTMFPQGTIKEGEVKYGQEITAGMANDVKSWFQNKEGKGKITEPMWQMLGQFAQRRADTGYAATQRDKIGQAPYLKARGIEPDDVYSFAEKPEAFGSPTQATAQSAPPATSPGQPSYMNLQAPSSPPPAAPKLDAVTQYSRLKPGTQQGLQAAAEKLGVDLSDPESPQFEANFHRVVQMVRQGAQGAPSNVAGAQPALTPPTQREDSFSRAERLRNSRFSDNEALAAANDRASKLDAKRKEILKQRESSGGFNP